MNDPENDPCINGPKLTLVTDRPYHTAEWADGKKLAEWLYENDILGPQTDAEWKNDHRRVRIYASGSEDASLAVVDRIMAKAGSHLSEIPDEVWLKERRLRPRSTKVTPELKEEAIERVKAGESMVSVGEALGIKAKTIQTWVFRAGISVASIRKAERDKKKAVVERLADEGFTPAEIALKAGVSRRSVYDWIPPRRRAA